MSQIPFPSDLMEYWDMSHVGCGGTFRFQDNDFGYLWVCDSCGERIRFYSK